MVPDRLTHDHPTVETISARIDRTAAGRPQLVVPDLDPRSDPVRVVIDGRTRHAVVETGLDGAVVIRGAYDNARLARAREGPDRLRAWLDAADLAPGRSVNVDVVTRDLLGVRAPGERAVYTVSEGPRSSLRDIARSVSDRPDDGPAEADGATDDDAAVDDEPGGHSPFSAGPDAADDGDADATNE